MQRHDHLRQLLSALEPADPLEAQHKASIVQLLDSASDPFGRAHYAPGHITASAFVTNPQHDALLLILHGKLKRWLQPGGHVEASDPDVLHAARREVREELGLTAIEPVGSGLLDVDVHDIPARPDQPAHTHFDVRFLFVTSAADSFQAGSDARAARWVSIAELLHGPEAGASALPSDESVLRAVRKLQRVRAWA